MPVAVKTSAAVFQSTPPATGGDTANGRRKVSGVLLFQSTPPSTGGDTRAPSQCGHASCGFNPRRLQQAATPGGSVLGGGGGLVVSIHAAFNRRRHRPRPPVADSEHPRFNPRRLQQAATPEEPPGRRTPPSVSIHAAFNRRRHTEDGIPAGGAGKMFQSTPPSTGGDTAKRSGRARARLPRFNPRRLQQAATPAPLSQQGPGPRPGFNPRRLQQAATPPPRPPAAGAASCFNPRRLQQAATRST